MKKNLLVLFLFVCSINSFAQTLANQNVILSSLGTPPLHYSYIKGVPLPTGGFALLYNEYISGLEADYILVKIDATGNMVATTSYNGLHNSKDFGTNICATDSFVYAVGFTMDSSGTNSRTFNCLKINIATWDTIWTHGENIDSGVAELATTVLADDSGNVYVGGTVQTATDNHMTLIKYAPDGTKLWTTHYSGTYAYVSPVSMSFSGRFINVTGYSFDGIGHSNTVTAGFDKYTGSFWGDKVESGGIGIISHPVNIAVDQQANSYISGSSTVSGTNSVIKTVSYDASFNPLWVSTWGDSSLTNTASGMVVDLMGLNENIFISGSTVNSSGQHSMVVLRYTMDGTLKWARILTASNPAFPTDGVGITTDGIGNCYATGTQYNGIDTDIVTVAYDSTGTVLWKKIYNSATGVDDVPFSILMGGSESNSVIVSARSGGSSPDYKAIEYDQRQAVPCGDTICPTITYSFGTGTVTTAGIDTFIEFDIYAKQNEPSLAYYGGNIIFTYGKDVFGNSVVDSNHIVITRGTIISDINYMYSLKDTIYKSDALPPNGGEVLLSIAPHSSSGLYAIADTFQQLCHVKMKRKNRGSLGIGFDQFYMQNESFFADGAYTFVNTVRTINSTRSINDSIIFSIINAVVDSTHTHLDFDIIGNAFIYDGPLASYTITFSYNQLAFDYVDITNVLGCGANIFQDSVYDFSYNSFNGHMGIYLQDNANFDLIFDSINDFIYDSTVIAHVRFHIADCGELPNIYIDPANSAADWADSTGFTAYSPVVAGSGYNNGGNPMCVPLPKVSGWTPDCATAGSFDVLTIRGRHFGDTIGTLYFTNANRSPTIFPAYPQDIRHWDDNEIQVLIPSQPEDGLIAGSGFFYIKTAAGLTNAADSEKISIAFANYNKRGMDSTARFVYYTNQSNITFKLDSALFYNNDAKVTLLIVMNDLACRTGLNFFIDPQPATIDTPIANDGVRLISLKPFSKFDFPSTSTLIVTDLTKRFQSCINGLPIYNNVADYPEDGDITIRSDPPGGCTWNWNNLNIPNTTQYDFLTEMEHELGHYALLCHTTPKSGNNITNIMYYGTSPGDHIPNYGYDPDDMLGVIHILDLGTTLGTSGSCIPSMASASPGCNPGVTRPTNCVARINSTNINGILPISYDESNFIATLYPNPYQQNTIIQIETPDYEDFTINVFDIVGQMVKHVSVSGSGIFDVPLSDFEKGAGIYLIEISDIHGKQIFKLIKI